MKILDFIKSVLLRAWILVLSPIIFLMALGMLVLVRIFKLFFR